MYHCASAAALLASASEHKSYKSATLKLLLVAPCCLLNTILSFESDTGVSMGCGVTYLIESCTKCFVPIVPPLHCSIDCVDKCAYVILVSRFNKAFRLFHINIFLHQAVQVCPNHCASAAALLASASEHKSTALVSSALLSSQQHILLQWWREPQLLVICYSR